LDFYFAIEVISVFFGLLFLVLLIRQNILCWWFGIAGSLLSIFLFYHNRLYSEAILYTYYVFMGFYGYNYWSNNKSKNNLSLKVSEKGLAFHLMAIVGSALTAISLGWYFENYSDANSPYLDALTTIFSFFATYLEAKKILSAWIYWIIINGLTIGLYLTKGLDIYSILSFIYCVMSFIGYIKWKKELV
tara:strand:- start:8025 stop:8591 length:567 start_codon:yes stop_codon:yes gene_type:complete